jgi:hypothetical protein
MSTLLKGLYDQDFYTWALESAQALRERRFADIDIGHIAEELEDMGQGRERALESQLTRLIAHLLKWSQQPEARPWCGNSWQASICNARREIQKLLKRNPGLKPKIQEIFEDAYAGAVEWAIMDTNLPESRFPPACPWSLKQAMDEGFWP